MPLGGIIRLLSIVGGKGILVGLVLALAIGGGGMCMGDQGLGCLGGGTSSQYDDGTGRTGGTGRSGQQVSSSPQEEELVSFVGFVFDDVQNMWDEQLAGYDTSKLVLFRRGVRSACGTASTAVGPFYCPLDRKVYIDLSFYNELRARFGAPGDFAQAYVIAHELGHHVQNLTDQLGARGNREQIAVELQADCFAGAWARDADRRGLIEVGDIDEALNAAAAIGDDTLQRKSQGYVQPESWTHGSAQQRSSAFRRGFAGGPKACNQ